ncbi:MAG: DMT family transporter [Planctomycetota bacterium]
MLAAFATRHPAIGLGIVTVFWGLSFSLMRNWQVRAREWTGDDLLRQSLASLLLMVIRMTAGFTVFGLMVARAKPGHGWMAGALVGVAMGLGLFLQLWGLAFTTPALCAFFTGLASLWVPVLAFVATGASVGRANLVGLALSLAGGVLLVEGGWRLGAGEWLTLAASVMFAAQIVVLDRLGRGADAGRLTAGFFLAIATLTLAASLAMAPAVGWTETGGFLAATLSDPWVALDLALLVGLPTLWGFWWMNLCQPRLDATRAGLIYLLEPVFSTFFSCLIGHDALTAPLVAGGALVLLGNAVAELGSRSRKADESPAESGIEA